MTAWNARADPAPPAEMLMTFAPFRTAHRIPRIIVASVEYPSRSAICTGMTSATPAAPGATPTTPTPLAGAAAMPATWVP